MTLDEYLKSYKISNAKFALSVGEKHAENVRRWRHFMVIPRRDKLTKIKDVTNNKVTPNDFYSLSPSSSLLEEKAGAHARRGCRDVSSSPIYAEVTS